MAIKAERSKSMRKQKRTLSTVLLMIIAVLCMTVSGAAAQTAEGGSDTVQVSATSEAATAETASDEAASAETTSAGTASTGTEEDKSAKDAPAEKNGDIYILYTSDVHCGIDQGFGYAGLKQVRDTLEENGYETILVDDGDSVQGEVIGTITKGDAIIDLMNEVGYDVVIPGNHDFDYGVEQFLDLVKKADFPYISCNFTYQDKLVFKPYTILEAAGKKIGFVGVTTPYTIRTSTPSYFQDENGEYVYGFMGDQTGERVYQAVQEAADAARADGAEYVYVIAHLGNEEECRPWTYADVIANTNGIDVLLDGHSHDTDQIVMKNKDGKEVTRSAVGTKMNCIGYSHISAKGEIVETGIWTWPNKKPAPELLNIKNEIRDKVDAAQEDVLKQVNHTVASTAVSLVVDDPELKDASGNPVRIIRTAETNLGDLCADAFRDQSGADIAFMNGGGIRAGIEKGDISYKNIIDVFPYGNTLCVVEVTGQQILDALEWGSRAVPSESGAFLQVSGLSYTIDSKVSNPCQQDENGMFLSVEGERRVKNVKVGEEPLDPEKTYTLAGHSYMLLKNGDGYTMFDGAPLLQDRVKLDNQLLIDYITGTLGGVIGEGYENPYGQGRIEVLDSGE